jgi:hypothetical protein
LPLRTLAERGDTMLAGFFVMQSDVQGVLEWRIGALGT